MTLLDRSPRICIVGCGLIGGSMALALRRAGFQGTITATDTDQALAIALERGVIDCREDSFQEGRVSDADLIFLAAPIGVIVDHLRRASSLIKPGALVTDAGSTKAEICRIAVQSLPAGVDFVGGHPMAGSEHSGVEYARADLFDRATYALVPGSRTPTERLTEMEGLVEAIGARPLIMDADQHDRAVATVSHLPQLLATILSTLIASDSEKSQTALPSDDSDEIELARRMAAGGWRDMTRLAGSSFGIWRDIIMTNQPYLTDALGDLLSRLQAAHEALERKDYQTIRLLFEEANRSVRELRKSHYRSFDKV